MGYKQPGYGNGKRPSTVPTSPLNLRNKKKEKEYRERMLSKHEGEDAKMYKYKGQETNVKRALPSQYSGMSKKKREKLMSKAQEKAQAAQAKLDAGGKLNSREQRFLDEHNYNLKQQKSKTDISTERKRIQAERDEYVKSGKIYEDQADRMAEALKQLGPDAGYAGDPGLRFNPGGTNLRAQLKDPNVEYWEGKVHPMSGDSSYINRQFMEKYPHLAEKFGLRVGSRLNAIPLAKNTGLVKLDKKGLEQIPNESKMELKRPKNLPNVEEKKPVVKKEKVVKPKPKKEPLYDLPIPEGTRSSTTLTPMTDASHFMEGHEDKYDAALKYRKRKNKKSKK